MMKTNIIFPLFVLLTLLMSCTKENFGRAKNSDIEDQANRNKFTQSACSNRTLVKPPVDVLFLVDNSASTLYLNSALKTALKNTIQLISEDFDYHVYVAPLIPVSGENVQTYPLIVSSHRGLPGSANVVASSDINIFSHAWLQGGSREHGFKRVKQIIDANMGSSETNGIFRRNAYTLVVLISNGDDNDVIVDSQNNIIGTNYTENLENLKKYSNRHSSSILKSREFRFLSIVAHSQCHENYKIGRYYRQMSQDIYNYVSQKGGNPDSFNLCGGNYNTLFSYVSQNIKSLILPHKYNYWPLAEEQNREIDPAEIRVFKSSGVELQNGNTSHGFTYEGYKSNINTRYEPSAGEPVSGHVIKLYGSGQVVYPECLQIKYQEPFQYNGYVVISRRPNVSSINVFKNGSKLPQGQPNGWVYQGYSPSINTRITGPNDHTSKEPGIYRTGYVIKLYGNAIYTNEDKVEVVFQPEVD